MIGSDMKDYPMACENCGELGKLHNIYIDSRKTKCMVLLCKKCMGDLAVSDEMAELMEGQKTKEEFKKDLINLTEKYFASETFYDVVESLN